MSDLGAPEQKGILRFVADTSGVKEALALLPALATEAAAKMNQALAQGMAVSPGAPGRPTPIPPTVVAPTPRPTPTPVIPVAPGGRAGVATFGAAQTAAWTEFERSITRALDITRISAQRFAAVLPNMQAQIAAGVAPTRAVAAAQAQYGTMLRQGRIDAQQYGQAMAQLPVVTDQANSALTRFGRQILRHLGWIASAVVLYGSWRIAAAALGEAIKTQQQLAMARVQTPQLQFDDKTLRTIATITRAYAGDMSSAVEVTALWAKRTGDLNQALYLTAMSQKYSSATGIQMQQVYQTMSAMVEGLGLSYKNVPRLMELMIAASKRWGTSLREVGEDAGKQLGLLGSGFQSMPALIGKAMERSSYSLSKLGIGVEVQFGIIASMIQQMGTRAETVGEQLPRIMSQIASSKQLHQFFRGIGVEVDLSVAGLARMATAYEKLNRSQQAQVIAWMGGTRQFEQSGKFMESLLATLKKMPEVLKDNTALEELFAEVQKTAQFQIDRTKASWEAMTTVLLQRALPALTKIAAWMAGSLIPALQRSAEWIGKHGSALTLAALAATTFFVPAMLRAVVAIGQMVTGGKLATVLFGREMVAAFTAAGGGAVTFARMAVGAIATVVAETLVLTAAVIAAYRAMQYLSDPKMYYKRQALVAAEVYGKSDQAEDATTRGRRAALGQILQGQQPIARTEMINRMIGLERDMEAKADQTTRKELHKLRSEHPLLYDRRAVPWARRAEENRYYAGVAELYNRRMGPGAEATGEIERMMSELQRQYRDDRLKGIPGAGTLPEEAAKGGARATRERETALNTVLELQQRIAELEHRNADAARIDLAQRVIKYGEQITALKGRERLEAEIYLARFARLSGEKITEDNLFAKQRGFSEYRVRMYQAQAQAAEMAGEYEQARILTTQGVYEQAMGTYRDTVTALQDIGVSRGDAANMALAEATAVEKLGRVTAEEKARADTYQRTTAAMDRRVEMLQLTLAGYEAVGNEAAWASTEEQIWQTEASKRVADYSEGLRKSHHTIQQIGVAGVIMWQLLSGEREQAVTRRTRDERIGWLESRLNEFKRRAEAYDAAGRLGEAWQARQEARHAEFGLPDQPEKSLVWLRAAREAAGLTRNATERLQITRRIYEMEFSIWGLEEEGARKAAAHAAERVTIDALRAREDAQVEVLALRRRMALTPLGAAGRGGIELQRAAELEQAMRKYARMQQDFLLEHRDELENEQYRRALLMPQAAVEGQFGVGDKATLAIAKLRADVAAHAERMAGIGDEILLANLRTTEKYREAWVSAFNSISDRWAETVTESLAEGGRFGEGMLKLFRGLGAEWLTAQFKRLPFFQQFVGNITDIQMKGQGMPTRTQIEGQMAQLSPGQKLLVDAQTRNTTAIEGLTTAIQGNVTGGRAGFLSAGTGLTGLPTMNFGAGAGDLTGVTSLPGLEAEGARFDAWIGTQKAAASQHARNLQVSLSQAFQGITSAVALRQAYKQGDWLGGAAAGASLGGLFGPTGAAIGAGVGALLGLFGGKKEPELTPEQLATLRARPWAAKDVMWATTTRLPASYYLSGAAYAPGAQAAMLGQYGVGNAPHAPPTLINPPAVYQGGPSGNVTLNGDIHLPGVTNAEEFVRDLRRIANGSAYNDQYARGVRLGLPG